jgi:hypothetical protein
VIVVIGSTAKLAVTVAAALRVSDCGVVIPLSAPPNPVKEYPPLGVAVTCTAPAFCHPLPGEILPPDP